MPIIIRQIGTRWDYLAYQSSFKHGPLSIYFLTQSEYICPASFTKIVDLLKVTSVIAIICAFISLFYTASYASPHEGYFLKASFYSSGSRTASGEHFNQYGYTAASRTLPFGTRLYVTNPATGRSVIVRINDRGPFILGRDLDLARGAAAAIGMIEQGTATLKIVDWASLSTSKSL